MKIRPPLGLAVLAGRLFAGLLGTTCRVRSVTGRDVPAPAILACWHEQILAAVPWLLRTIRGGRHLTVMASRSRDGELTSRIAAAYGVRAMRGSTSSGGRESLVALYREVKRTGTSALVLPDGPRGPRRVPKAGVVVLAQMTEAPLVPFACVPRRAVILKSWDRMLLPVPFSSVRVAIGAPLRVPRRLTEPERDRHVAELRDQLLELTRLASPHAD